MSDSVPRKSLLLSYYNVCKCCKVMIILLPLVYANTLEKIFFNIQYNLVIKISFQITSPKEAQTDGFWYWALDYLNCQGLQATMSPVLASHLKRYSGDMGIEFKRLFKKQKVRRGWSSINQATKGTSKLFVMTGKDSGRLANTLENRRPQNLTEQSSMWAGAVKFTSSRCLAHARRSAHLC